MYKIHIVILQLIFLLWQIILVKFICFLKIITSPQCFSFTCSLNYWVFEAFSFNSSKEYTVVSSCGPPTSHLSLILVVQRTSAEVSISHLLTYLITETSINTTGGQSHTRHSYNCSYGTKEMLLVRFIFHIIWLFHLVWHLFQNGVLWYKEQKDPPLPSLFSRRQLSDMEDRFILASSFNSLRVLVGPGNIFLCCQQRLVSNLWVLIFTEFSAYLFQTCTNRCKIDKGGKRTCEFNCLYK